MFCQSAGPTWQGKIRETRPTILLTHPLARLQNGTGFSLCGGKMQRVLRAALVWFLLPGLCLAGVGTNAVPYGFVAHERSSNVIAGLTLFSGNEVRTHVNGYAAIVLTKSSLKLHLLEKSTLRISGDPETPVVELSRGAFRFAVEPGQVLTVKVAGATVEPEGHDHFAQGEVSKIAPNEITVAALSAPIRVRAGEETVVVPKGSLYTLRVDPEPPQGPQGQGAPQAQRRRAILIMAGVAIAVATAIGIYLNNPAGAGDTGGFVSPFIP